jgi:hypothetical protein
MREAVQRVQARCSAADATAKVFSSVRICLFYWIGVVSECALMIAQMCVNARVYCMECYTYPLGMGVRTVGGRHNAPAATQQRRSERSIVTAHVACTMQRRSELHVYTQTVYNDRDVGCIATRALEQRVRARRHTRQAAAAISIGFRICVAVEHAQ